MITEPSRESENVHRPFRLIEGGNRAWLLRTSNSALLRVMSTHHSYMSGGESSLQKKHNKEQEQKPKPFRLRKQKEQKIIQKRKRECAFSY